MCLLPHLRFPLTNASQPCVQIDDTNMSNERDGINFSNERDDPNIYIELGHLRRSYNYTCNMNVIIRYSCFTRTIRNNKEEDLRKSSKAENEGSDQIQPRLERMLPSGMDTINFSNPKADSRSHVLTILKSRDLLRTHIFLRTRELPQFSISPKPLFLSKNRLRDPPKQLGSFENSYIPENPRTPKPLTFSKNRLREAKNRSNTSSKKVHIKINIIVRTLLLRSLGDEAVTASGLCSRRRRSYTITASGFRSRRRRSSTSVIRPPSSQSSVDKFKWRKTVKVKKEVFIHEIIAVFNIQWIGLRVCKLRAEFTLTPRVPHLKSNMSID
ncbi:hypothetical protein LXL04_007320 [Taraxacum kok-saghyz]